MIKLVININLLLWTQSPWKTYKGYLYITNLLAFFFSLFCFFVLFCSSTSTSTTILQLTHDILEKLVPARGGPRRRCPARVLSLLIGGGGGAFFAVHVLLDLVAAVLRPIRHPRFASGDQFLRRAAVSWAFSFTLAPITHLNWLSVFAVIVAAIPTKIFFFKQKIIIN